MEGQTVVDYFWNLTYSNTVFDTIWIYALVIIVAWAASKILLMVCPYEKLKYIICTLISAIASILMLTREQNVFCYAYAAVIIMSIIILVFFSVKAWVKIGNVSDVVYSFRKVQLANAQIAFLGILFSVGLIDVANRLFLTSIPKFVPYALFSIFYLCLQIKWVIYVFRGYYFIGNFVKKNGLFYFEDYCSKEELAYLNDSEEYAASVTNILIQKKKIYELSVGDHCYLNRKTERIFEKGIKGGISSKKIKDSLTTDFRDVGFDAVYKAVFATIKGYEIDFTESQAAKERKTSGIGIGATEFVLMRYPIEDHVILHEDKEVRADYITALDALVRRGKIDSDKWTAKIEEYCQVFGIEKLGEDAYAAVERFSKIIKRKEKLFWSVKSDYSCLLLLEAIYFQNLLTEDDISYKEIETIFEELKIKRKYLDFVYQYIKAMYIDGNTKTAGDLLRANEKIGICHVLEYVHRNIMWNERYVVQRQYKMAVCATVSAGKSTFINAMLGLDFIPSKNQVCTAKITTIRDNDNIKNIIGCYRRTDNTKVYSNIIDAAVLERWNEDENVSETILEADIEDVTCRNGVLTLYDTPGTNNSENEIHHGITIDFLKNTDLDLVIFLFNAEYISTTDTETLLKEILAIEKDRDTQIVFGLNKIDCLDEEAGESLSSMVDALKQQLLSYGFDNPIIFPFSANAARLFKMVLKGREMTKREQRVFDDYMRYFSQKNAADSIVGAQWDTSRDMYWEYRKGKTVEIRGETYTFNQIVNALDHTGLLHIENWISCNMEE